MNVMKANFKEELNKGQGSWQLMAKSFMKVNFKMEWCMVKVRNWNSNIEKELIHGKTKNVIKESGKKGRWMDLE